LNLKAIENKIIHRGCFHLGLKKVIEDHNMVEGKDVDEIKIEELRQNFKGKFNHICGIS